MPKPDRTLTPAEMLAATHPAGARLPDGRTMRRWACRLRDLRYELGLSAAEVARALEMTQSNLSRIESGREPGLSVAKKLATFFGLPIEEIWIKRQDAAAHDAQPEEPGRA